MSEPLKVLADLDEVTLDDMVIFEELTGVEYEDYLAGKIMRCPGPDECEFEHKPHSKGKPIPTPGDPKKRPLRMRKPSAKQLMALVYIFAKKADPDVTWEKVKATPVTKIEFQEVDVADPTVPDETNDSDSG